MKNNLAMIVCTIAMVTMLAVINVTKAQNPDECLAIGAECTQSETCCNDNLGASGYCLPDRQDPAKWMCNICSMEGEGCSSAAECCNIGGLSGRLEDLTCRDSQCIRCTTDVEGGDCSTTGLCCSGEECINGLCQQYAVESRSTCSQLRGFCLDDSMCCSDALPCILLKCGCRAFAKDCERKEDCCDESHYCIKGSCRLCRLGHYCEKDEDCCNPDYTCQASQCKPPMPAGWPCSRDKDCITDVCRQGSCGICVPDGGSCATTGQCCSDKVCIEGLCQDCSKRFGACSSAEECCNPSLGCNEGGCGCLSRGDNCHSANQCCQDLTSCIMNKCSYWPY